MVLVVDPLGWLGLRGDDAPTLRAIHAHVRDVLPDDEPVVQRYVVAVCVLLARVAHADGGLAQAETEHIRALLERLDRVPTARIDDLCEALHTRAPAISQRELDACIRELKALCDGRERRQVVRLLAALAHADGALSAAEIEAVGAIADALGVERPGLAEGPADDRARSDRSS